MNGMQPKTRYARSGELNIAYQVVGDGPIDLVFTFGWASHLDFQWTDPTLTRFLRRLAQFARVIVFDKRGVGLSDPIGRASTLEERMDDIRAVMDAVRSERAALLGYSEGGAMAALYAAAHPDRTIALVMYDVGVWAARSRAEPGRRTVARGGSPSACGDRLLGRRRVA